MAKQFDNQISAAKPAKKAGEYSVPKQHEQLAFDLAYRSALGVEDFLVSPSNEEALSLIDRWPNWQHWAVVICGAAQAGKSHLANVWRLKSDAILLDAPSMSIDRVQQVVAAKTIVIEDIDKGFGADCIDANRIDQQAFFHLLNLAREHQLSILITSKTAPGDLDITLPDLRSRLCALPMAKIHEPEENLLRAVLVKHFADRQLNVEPPVVDYLMAYMERSMGAAASVVDNIDKKTLASRRKVSQKLASEVLVAMMDAQNDEER